MCTGHTVAMIYLAVRHKLSVEPICIIRGIALLSKENLSSGRSCTEEWHNQHKKDVKMVKIGFHKRLKGCLSAARYVFFTM